MTSDEEFTADIADTVALVARGDIAAFAIPGQTTITAAGAHRFGLTYAALATAAAKRSRALVLRWQFDAPGSELAKQRTVANAEQLVAALVPFAVDGVLPATVRVEFEALGPIPAALREKINTLNIAVL